jgi:hypothetical protein
VAWGGGVKVGRQKGVGRKPDATKRTVRVVPWSRTDRLAQEVPRSGPAEVRLKPDATKKSG